MIYYDYKKNCHNNNALNLYKKYSVTLVFHVQQFTIGMLNLIRAEITLKMNLVPVDQEVWSLQKALKLSVNWSTLIHISHTKRYKTPCRLDRQQLNLFSMIILVWERLHAVGCPIFWLKLKDRAASIIPWRWKLVLVLWSRDEASKSSSVCKQWSSSYQNS